MQQLTEVICGRPKDLSLERATGRLKRDQHQRVARAAWTRDITNNNHNLDARHGMSTNVMFDIAAKHDSHELFHHFVHGR